MNSFKHPSLNFSADLKNLTQGLLAKLGCNYFQYLKVFKDGSYSFVTNQPDWSCFALEYLNRTDKPAVYSHIDATTLDKDTYIFLWEPNLPKEPVSLARQFNIAHGMTFVERHPDFYYMIGFGAPSEHHRAIDNYFNSLSEMKCFIQEFKDNHKQLISNIDKCRIVVPKNRQDANLDKMLYPKNSSHASNCQRHLTAQELMCIQGLAKGKTYKEIAQSMAVSPRTVETYLNRVRLRYNLRYKRELIKLLNTL